MNLDGTSSFLPGVDTSHVYVRAWALDCFHSLISTRTRDTERGRERERQRERERGRKTERQRQTEREREAEGESDFDVVLLTDGIC